jgi:hypothetical protein
VRAIGGNNRTGQARRSTLGVALAAAAVAALLPLALARASVPATPQATAYVADGTVNAVAHATDPVTKQGRTYIGGNFQHVGPLVGHGVAFSKPANDGTGGGIDPGWPGSAAGNFPQFYGGEVKAVASDEHGGWYVGGSFTDVGGEPAGQHFSRLVHVGSNGQLDTGWKPSPNDDVLALSEISYKPTPSAGTLSQLYVGGKFSSIGGQTRSNAAAYKLDPSSGAPLVPTCNVAADKTSCAIYTGCNPSTQTCSNQDYTCAGTPGPCQLSPARPVDSWKPEPKDWVWTLAASTATFDVGVDPGPYVRTTMPLVIAGGDFSSGIGSQSTQVLTRLALVWGLGVTDKTGATPLSGTTLNPANTSSNISPANPGATVRALAIGPSITTGAVGTTAGFRPVYFSGDFTAPKNQVGAYQLKVTVDGTSRGNVAFGSGGGDGALYSSWTPFSGAGPTVRTLALSTDGATLYAGGDFTATSPAGQTTPRNRVVAITGIPATAVNNPNCPLTGAGSCPATIDTAWNPNPDGTKVNALAVSQVGGQDAVFVGGDFTQIGGGASQATRSGLAAVAGAGSGSTGQALAWDPKLAGGAVNALDVDASSPDVFAGGTFNSAGAVARSNVAALDSSGVADPNWNPGTDATVQAIASDGTNVYLGGDFTKVASTDRYHLAAVSASDGTLNTAWHPAAHSPCTVTAPATNCTSPGSSGSCSVTAPATTCELPTTVMALALTPQALYVGGAFTQIDKAGDGCPSTLHPADCGTARSRIAALTPAGAADPGAPIAGWTPDASDPSVANVRAIDVTCGAVYVGGSFATIGMPATPGDPQPVSKNLAAIFPVGHENETGQDDAGQLAWGNPEAGSTVYAITHSRDGGVIYVGGNFPDIGVRDAAGNGHAVRANIAALNSADGTVTGWNPSADGTVRALAVSADNNTVYAGGSFATISGVARSRLAALQANGVGDGTGNDAGFAPEPNDTVQALNVTPDASGGDQLFIGGAYDEMATGARSGYTAYSAPNPSDGSAATACPKLDKSPPQIVSPAVVKAPDPTLQFQLTKPATVSVSLTRLVNGYMLHPDIDSKEHDCLQVSRKAAYNSLEIELAHKLDRIQDKINAKMRARDAALVRRALPPAKAALAKSLRKTFRKRALTPTLAAQRAYVLKIEKARHCTSIPMGSINGVSGVAGSNAIDLSQKLGDLPAGTYRAVIKATGVHPPTTSATLDFTL